MELVVVGLVSALGLPPFCLIFSDFGGSRVVVFMRFWGVGYTGLGLGGGSFGLVFVGEPVGYLLTSLLAKPFRVVLSFSLSVVAVFLRVTTSSLSGLPYHAPSSMFPGRLTSRSPCSSVDFGISWSVSVACVPFSPSPSIRLSRVLWGSTRERCFPPCSVRWLVLVVAWMA